MITFANAYDDGGLWTSSDGTWEDTHIALLTSAPAAKY